MAFSYPLALHLPPMSRDLLPTKVDAIIAAIKRDHRVPSSLRELAGELIFEKYSGESVNTIGLTSEYASAGAAVRHGKWLRLSFALRLDTGLYEAELFVFPIPDEPGLGGLQLNFEGRAYAAMYEFQSRSSGRFNEHVKRDLSLACYQVAAEAQADGFILLPEDGRLASPSLSEILERLLHPQMELHGRRAGLMTGVRHNLLPPDELRKLWQLSANDSRLVATTSGYSVLDLLQPFTGA